MGNKLASISSVYRLEKIVYLWCETPCFPGGEREVGAIDLRVQRDSLTKIPILEGTTIKGALRSYFKISNTLTNEIPYIFGDLTQAGNVIFSRAHILLFPVRAFVPPFLFVTSPQQINIWIQSLSDIKLKEAEDMQNNFRLTYGTLLKLGENAGICSSKSLAEQEVILLDGEMTIKCEYSENFESLISSILNQALPRMGENIWAGYEYIQDIIREDTILVPDGKFREIANKGLEVVIRIALEYETKTVRRGALFYQERIPRYTLFFAPLYISVRASLKNEINDAVNKFISQLKNNLVINIGGDESTGKGRMRLVLWP